jgi:hypothetical protein
VEKASGDRRPRPPSPGLITGPGVLSTLGAIMLSIDSGLGFVLLPLLPPLEHFLFPPPPPPLSLATFLAGGSLGAVKSDDPRFLPLGFSGEGGVFRASLPTVSPAGGCGTVSVSTSSSSSLDPTPLELEPSDAFRCFFFSPCWHRGGGGGGRVILPWAWSGGSGKKTRGVRSSSSFADVGGGTSNLTGLEAPKPVGDGDMMASMLKLTIDGVNLALRGPEMTDWIGKTRYNLSLR